MFVNMISPSAYHKKNKFVRWMTAAHHEQSFRAVSDHLPYCKPPVCALGDHVLPESKKTTGERTTEPTQQELVAKASQKAGFSKKKKKQSILVNSSERERFAMVMGQTFRRAANNLTDQVQSKGP